MATLLDCVRQLRAEGATWFYDHDNGGDLVAIEAVTPDRYAEDDETADDGDYFVTSRHLGLGQRPTLYRGVFRTCEDSGYLVLEVVPRSVWEWLRMPWPRPEPPAIRDDDRDVVRTQAERDSIEHAPMSVWHWLKHPAVHLEDA